MYVFLSSFLYSGIVFYSLYRYYCAALGAILEAAGPGPGERCHEDQAGYHGEGSAVSGLLCGWSSAEQLSVG